MSAHAGNGAEPLPAGPFGAWVLRMQAAMRGEQDADVPCGSCTACCRSAQFIHIEPDETDTLAHIPRALLFPAPGRPKGHVVLGYDERGHCPMLVDDACSIYPHRPRTCRTYDCRIFAATGLDAEDDGKPAIAERARRWRFDYPQAQDRARQDAVLDAAAFLADEAQRRPGTAPASSTQQAAAAVAICDAFAADRPTPKG